MIRIPLTQGMFALIDDDDYALVSGYSWCLARCGKGHTYAVTRKDGGSLYMHRLLMGLAGMGLEIDHMNHDGLDNRRSNIRAVSRSVNQLNRGTRSRSNSGITGVHLRKDGKWQAYLGSKVIGYFSSKEEAVEARIRTERSYLNSALAN